MHTTKWTTTKKTTIRGLDVLQTVYGVIMGLGLKNVFDKSYNFLSGNTRSILSPGPWANLDPGWVKLVIVLFLVLNVLLIGIRFFWVPRNLRRQLAIRVYAHLGTETVTPSRTAISLMVIMLHAALYYLLCSEFGFFISGIHANSPFQFQSFSGCAWTQAMLLSVNAAWIVWLDADGARPHEMHDGVLWVRNNLVCCLIALPPLTLMSCRYPTQMSLETVASNAGVFFQAFPAAPLTILRFFGALARRLPVAPEIVATLWIMAAYMANSVVDLFGTAGNYIFLEEVELAETVSRDAGNGQGP